MKRNIFPIILILIVIITSGTFLSGIIWGMRDVNFSDDFENPAFLTKKISYQIKYLYLQPVLAYTAPTNIPTCPFSGGIPGEIYARAKECDWWWEEIDPGQYLDSACTLNNPYKLCEWMPDGRKYNYVEDSCFDDSWNFECGTTTGINAYNYWAISSCIGIWGGGGYGTYTYLCVMR